MSRLASAAVSAIAVAVAAVYVVRAGAGVSEERAYRRASLDVDAKRYREAASELAWAAVGANRDRTFWLDGWVALDLWDSATDAERISGAGGAFLERATASFLRGLSESPATGWYVSGLAEIYARRERVARATRTFDLAILERGPWAMAGDDGRLAIGFARLAVGREPNTAPFRDRLALLFWSFGLKNEALAAVRDSARVLPDFTAHNEEFTFDSLPRELAEAFYDASRANVGAAPLQPKERHLLSLGILAYRLGRLSDSEADLRAALQAPGSAQFHAEDAFHLGLTLLALGREAEAEPLFRRAEAFDVFVEPVLSTRASQAEAHGRLEEAFEAVSRLRARDPGDVGTCLRFAAIAARLDLPDRAEEALRFASVVAPDDPRPRRELVRLYLRTGRRSKAAAVLEELRGRGDGGAEFQDLEREVRAPAP